MRHHAILYYFEIFSKSLGKFYGFFRGLVGISFVFSRLFFRSVSFFFSRFGLGSFFRSVFWCLSRFFADFFSDSFYRKVLSFLVVYSLVFSQLFFYQTRVYAQNSVNPRLLNGRLPIEADGSTNTSVDRAANGVDVVNIAAPNSKGLSHNKFRNYNVNRDGLILNNSKGNRDGIVNSKLGGIILGNSHLVNSGSANVILNEVTSTNKSYLRGYTEVVGGRADLIVANPNGVEVNGGGFINVDKVSLVVGSVKGVGGVGGGVLGRDNLRFNLDVSDRVRDGFLPGLTILGSGLDVEDVGEVDLVSSVIEIMAPIYGGDQTDLSLRSGDDEFDYLTKAVSSVVGGGGIGVGGVSSDDQQGSELLAIDASNLAKVQSGRIYVVATREGFGVNFSDELLATKRGVEIDVNGDVSYRDILSGGGDIKIKSNNGDINISGQTRAGVINDNNKVNVILNAKNDININKDSILLGNNDITIISNNDFNNSGTIIFDNNINIHSENDFINNFLISSNNLITIKSNQKFRNGTLNSDNSLVKIISENSLNITSKESLNNYGTISSIKDLTLESTNSDINNNVNAEIISGNLNSGSKLKLIAKNGQVNQNSVNSLVSNGDLELDVEDFINSGRVDIAGDFILNVGNDLVNEEGALIYSGQNLTLNVVNQLINEAGAVIYAEGDIVVQKYGIDNVNYDVNDNKTGLIDNISAEIISYGEDISLEAEIINNRREIEPFNALLDPLNDGNILHNDTTTRPEHYTEYKWLNNNSGCFGNACQERYSGHYAKQLTNSGSIKSMIVSGNDIRIDVGELNNIASDIHADRNIDITANILNNQSINDPGLYSLTGRFSGNDDFTRIYSLGEITIIKFGQNGPNSRHSDSRLNHEDFAQNNPASIKAGGNITLNVVSDISNNDVSDNDDIGQIRTENPRFVNSVDIEEVLNSGRLDGDLDRYFDGSENQGLFVRSNNTNVPLFETRSQFVDQSKFFGSDYFYERLGLNLTDVQTEFEQQAKRLVGDQFFQHKLLVEQLRTIKKNALLLDDIDMDPDGEVKRLLDNAIEEYERLGLDIEDVNQRLTQSQIDNLEKDIIWYETQEIDGGLYIVPKIYLSKATREAIKNGEQQLSKSTISAGNNLNINSGSGGLRNQGSINGKNDVVINTQDRIVNDNFSEIDAGGDLSLISNGGDVINKSEIRAEGDIEIGAGGSFYNVATVTTNAKNLLDENLGGEFDIYFDNGNEVSNSGNIDSQLVEQAKISGDNVVISAGGDFVNLGSDIEADGDLAIRAGNDVEIGTVKLRDRSDMSWGSKSNGGRKIVDRIRNVGSEIGGGDILVESGGAISILGSDLSSERDLTIQAKDEILIGSVLDSSYQEEINRKTGTFNSSTSRIVRQKTRNVKSNIKSGADLNIKAGDDIIIIASDISGNGNGSIEAGKYLDKDINSDKFNQEIYNDNADIYILNSKDSDYFYKEVKKVKASLSDSGLIKGALLAPYTGGLSILTEGVKIDSNSEVIEKYDEIIVKSKLTFGGNLSLNSAGEVNIRASDLKSGINPGSNGSSNSGGELSITAGQITTNNFNDNTSQINVNDQASINIISDSQNSYSSHEITDLTIELGNLSIEGGRINLGTFENNKTKKAKSKQVNSNILALNGNLEIESQNDINLIASNISSLVSHEEKINDDNYGNLKLITQNGNVNILSAYDHEKVEESNTKADIFFELESNSSTLMASSGIEGEISSSSKENGIIVSSNLNGNKIEIISGQSLANSNDNLDKGNININSSNLTSLNRDISLISANSINLTTSSDFEKTSKESARLRIDVRVIVSSNIVESLKSIRDLKDVDFSDVISQYGSDGFQARLISGDDIDEALDGNEDGINSLSTLFNAGKGTTGKAGIDLHIEFDSEREFSESRVSVANNIYSNGDISLVAGSGWSGEEAQNAINSGDETANINISSSNIISNRDINLNANKGDLNITANTADSSSRKSQISAYLDISLIGGGVGGGVSVQSSKNSSQFYQNSLIKSGNNLTTNSKNDTNIISSNLISNNVDMVIGGDLSLVSKQNRSKSRSSGFSIGGNSGGNSQKSGNLGFNRSKSDRAWVDNQASIVAMNSVAISANDNIDIEGGLIANIVNYVDVDGLVNSDKSSWLDGENLLLNANSLTYRDIYDSDKGRSFGLNVSGSSRGSSQTGKGQNTVSFDLNYSSYEKEQITRATIGGGVVNLGTRLNLDGETNELASVNVDNLKTLEEEGVGINRDVRVAQEVVKDVGVEGIDFSIIYDSDSFNSDNYLSDYLKQINPLHSVMSAYSQVKSDILALGLEPIIINYGEEGKDQTVTLKDKSQINEYNQIIANNQGKEKGEVNVPIVIENEETGQKSYVFFTRDELANNSNNLSLEGKTLFDIDINSHTIDEIKFDPTLLSRNISSNGIMNNLEDSSKNAALQLGGFDEDGRFSIIYDPSSSKGSSFSYNNDSHDLKHDKPEFYETAFNFLSDTLEVGINYLGMNVISTGNQKLSEETINILTEHVKEQNILNETNDYIILSGHSGGDLRNHISVTNADKNQFLDDNGNSVLKIRHYGGPINNSEIEAAANYSGAETVDIQNNSGDFVTNGLGGNGDVIQGVWSILNIFSLFEPGLKPNLDYFEEKREYDNQKKARKKDSSIPDPREPNLLKAIYSPHSIYTCSDSECNFN